MKPLEAALAPGPLPLPPPPSAPPTPACPDGFRPVGQCDCVENSAERPKIKPRPGAPEICAIIEKSRKSGGPAAPLLPSMTGAPAPKANRSLPLVHCEWFHLEPGRCECAHHPGEPGSVSSTPENLKRCAEEYAKGNGGKGFEYNEHSPVRETKKK